MITISTNEFTSTKDAEIDGHIYHVRKIGAGEALDLSQLSEKVARLRIESVNLGAKSQKTGEDVSKAQKKVLSDFRSIMEHITSVYVGLFDDGEDGKKSEALVKRVGIENVPKIIDQVFGAE